MAMYVMKVVLEHVRCFRHLEIEFSNGSGPLLWSTFLGDNATGKTTLLKAIALGLCDQSSAAGLLRESDSGYIRYSEKSKSAMIRIELADENRPLTTFSITTIIEEHKSDNQVFESLTQHTEPEGDDFPWGRLFACAYGIGRGLSGTGDVATYATISAVYNLFNYAEGLQNPELIIRRANPKVFESKIRPLLKGILHVDEVHLRPNGITVDGPWGNEMPLRDLADGFRSTFLWVLDLLGWSISYNVQSKSDLVPAGIVLVDAIEEHLHPKWQQRIVSDLRHVFPKLQFITSTHSPLVASSIGDFSGPVPLEQLIHLEQRTGLVEKSKYAETVRGLSCDQVLASRYFDHIIDKDPRIERALGEASDLAAKGEQRTSDETTRYKYTLSAIKNILADGQTLIERDAKQHLYSELKSKIDELEKKLFGSEQ